MEGTEPIEAMVGTSDPVAKFNPVSRVVAAETDVLPPAARSEVFIADGAGRFGSVADDAEDKLRFAL